ncbi:MAG TPA: glycosyltransferase [Patescibacteria group bacterium]
MNFKNTQDYLFLPESYSAKKRISTENVLSLLILSIISVILLAICKLVFSVSVILSISAALAVFYFVIMLFKLTVVLNSFSSEFINFSAKEISSLQDKNLPVYTLLIPLYREEKVIDQVIKAVTSLDYPKDKLDVIITLEKYDTETINAIRKANPPAYIKTLILPDVHPKTKPKALNVAFLQAKGKYLVIYDAEIIPDTDQLKKAVLAFKKYPEIGCLQTRLDHYNTRQSVITRLFNTEYSFYYDFFLPGLQKIGSPIPLSGHSSHFRTNLLKKIGAWDPYNVTEDCDIGMRLHRIGFQVGVIDSVSKEEATPTMKSWIYQRTRWMKGFIQTSMVHLRHPQRFRREIGGWKNLFVFFITVPGMVLINALNLFYWILLIFWLFTRSQMVQSFFPGPVLYLSLSSFIIGNFIFVYLNVIGAYKRGSYDLVKYTLLSPLYWFMLSVATVRAMGQIFISPHTWEKTEHGTHLEDISHSVSPASLQALPVNSKDSGGL